MKGAFYLFIFLSGLFHQEAVFAQGFNTFNGRNHPELKWQVAETEHFLIMYPERISGIQNEAAPIAESTYSSLSKNLDITFDKKIRIYFSDVDEINNGFAVPLNRPYTNIWVNLNDYSEIWTGQEKWLRKVIAHELAHIFHFKAVKSPLGLLQYAFANPLPSFWTEGLAQYQTEEWDSQRGDRWLRKAVFDDDLNFYSGLSRENGSLRYAVGNSQLRYFAEKYGDSTLVKLLGHREKLINLLEYHDFNSAFEEVIKGGYKEFYDEWRKHTSVYYNTIASQMERVDSLNSERFKFPGRFYFDAATSPNDSLTAVLSLTSMDRPVKRLHVIKNDSTKEVTFIGEGAINSDLSWTADNKHLLYSRMVRGANSSLLNDVFIYDLESGKEKQITFSRQAKYPIQGPEKDQIAYIVNEAGTGNLFTYDLSSTQEKRVTNFRGDIQLLWPQWIETERSWLVHLFSADGDRYLTLIDAETGKQTTIDQGDIDNRKAVVSPEGNKIAYVSLRDDVPNVFIYDFEKGTESRVTNLFTGGEVFGWVADHNSTGKEHLLIGASESRTEDKLFFVDAERKVYQPRINVPKNYARWRLQTPPNTISSNIDPNPELISKNYSYQPLKNLTHVISFGLPYYADADDYGVFATTNWTEPLSKHIISSGGYVSFPSPKEHSYGFLNYINNQFYPSLTFSLYRMPENGQFYGDDYLLEKHTGSGISISWPLDAFSAPYQSSHFFAKFRYFSTDPFNTDRFLANPSIAVPVEATVSDIQLSWIIKKQRPWKDNDFHPLDGNGLKVSLAIAENVLGSDVSSLSANLNSYTIFPFLGLNRFFLQGRFQAQWGNALPQNYIGFSHRDNITLNVPDQWPADFFGDNERVRGYREFVAGNKVAFGSIEYRIPFVPSLQTKILGLVRFGGLNVALFSDAGIVWEATASSGDTGTLHRWGAGVELKNELSFLGLSFTHAIGYAQPTAKLFTNQEEDIYYKIRAVVPF